ncbi:podoplanin isoform X2 [Sceloporus undulatus]|uniref:podoplanin isoform X2 n=1 Tax=Sceloporus undulatus TaxID=8520 RepID=UPI001C4AD2FA|nr:podoplanin isoform X2 [Sceloporus undulatus]
MLMKTPLLLFLLGSLSFCALAEEASTPVLEDEAATADLSDSLVSEAPTEGVMTTDSVLSTSEDSENTTDPGVPEPSDDGLETATMAGIIIGIIVAIGVATGIIIIIVKKVSGRP